MKEPKDAKVTTFKIILNTPEGEYVGGYTSDPIMALGYEIEMGWDISQVSFQPVVYVPVKTNKERIDGK